MSYRLDGYYEAQAQNNYFRGSHRQRGYGFGSSSLSIARKFFPIVSKYIVPATRKFVQDTYHEAVPQMRDVLDGKQTFGQAVKRTLKRSIRKQFGEGPPPKKRAKSVNKRKSRKRKKPANKKTRKTKGNKKKRGKSLQRKSTKQRSRADIFANFK